MFGRFGSLEAETLPDHANGVPDRLAVVERRLDPISPVVRGRLVGEGGVADIRDRPDQQTCRSERFPDLPELGRSLDVVAAGAVLPGQLDVFLGTIDVGPSREQRRGIGGA